MKGKKKKKAKKLCAAAMAAGLALGMGVPRIGFSLCLEAGAAGEPSSALGLTDTILALAEADFAANTATIQVLLDNLLGQVGADSAAGRIFQNVKNAMEDGSAKKESVVALMTAGRAILAGEPEESGAEETGESDNQEEPGTEEASESEGPGADETGESDNQEEPGTEEAGEPDTISVNFSTPARESSLPAYEPEGYDPSILADVVSLLLPSGWGNNAAGRSITSYSPVNGSGAISPSAGTLMTSFLTDQEKKGGSLVDAYEETLAGTSVNANVASEDMSAPGLPAKRIHYDMNVGANQFACELVCFEYEEQLYAVELMQGLNSALDYFPVYDHVVGSIDMTGAQTGENPADVSPAETEGTPETTAPETERTPETTAPETEATPETAAPETEGTPETTAPETEGTPETTAPETEGTPETAAPETEVTPETTAPESLLDGMDLSSFVYVMDGKKHAFPTSVREFEPEKLPFRLDAEMKYEHLMDGDDYNDLANTQYFFLGSSLYQELIGVSNFSRGPVSMDQGVVTALLDTKGPEVSLELPGGVKVGAPESAVEAAFPPFAQIGFDGIAQFQGDVLYTKSVTERRDGSHGYVMIRGDVPRCSTLTIICSGGVITELKFECLGPGRAWIFE